MATPSQSSPLDLDQFEGKDLSSEEFDASLPAVLLEECLRQRAEIARLRAALESIIGTLAFEVRNEDAPYGEAEHAMVEGIRFARAALAGQENA